MRGKAKNPPPDWPKVGDRVRPWPGLPGHGIKGPLQLPEGTVGTIISINKKDPFRPRYTVKWDIPPSEHPGYHLIKED